MTPIEQLEPRRVGIGYRRYLKRSTARFRRRQRKQWWSDAPLSNHYRGYAT